MAGIYARRGGGIPATFTLVAVAVLVALTIWLLFRTESNAADINGEAATIATTGRGINSNADAVLQLTHTNALAKSILATATPLHGELAHIVDLAGSVNTTAKSINASAGTINGDASSISGSASTISGTANTINGDAAAINSDAGSIAGSATAINSTAHGINSTAASILSVAQEINHGVNLINSNLDVTIGLAQQILGDAGNIVAEGGLANHEASCIDKALNHNSSPC